MGGMGPMSDIVPVRRWRRNVPKEHRTNLDTRLVWLWNQKFGTVQTVYNETEDILDKTAATLILQAVIGRDLDSMQTLLSRIEGGYKYDDELIDEDASLRI